VTSFELALVLLSAALHATWNTAAKGSASPAAYLFLLELCTAACTVPLLPFFSFADIGREVWITLGLTSVAHGFYAYWLTLAYRHGELSLVYPISRTTPAFLPLVAVPLLGEQLSPAGIAGIAAVVLGMWLVQTDGRLRRGELASRGALFAYLTLLSTVAYSLFDKRAMALLDASAWTGPAPRAVVYFFLLNAVHLPIFGLLARRELGRSALVQSAREQGLMLAGGLLANFASYTLILEALRRASASYVVAVRQASVLFVVAFSVLWLGERPGPVRLLGIAAMLAGVVSIALRG
jgi:drug/metabolite transporter (DMT)-like permease